MALRRTDFRVLLVNLYLAHQGGHPGAYGTYTPSPSPSCAGHVVLALVGTSSPGCGRRRIMPRRILGGPRGIQPPFGSLTLPPVPLPFLIPIFKPPVSPMSDGLRVTWQFPHSSPGVLGDPLILPCGSITEGTSNRDRSGFRP